MAKNSKTPIMVLQELSQKRNWPPPVYTIVKAIDGTHDNHYEYQVSVPDVSCMGGGPSKQVAKQDAAFKCLKQLQILRIYIPQENPTQEFSGGIPSATNASLKTAANFIAPLKDLCFEHKITDPIFTEISNAGPAHCKEFTYECQVASMKTQATAGTKKQAKQLAAQEMMDKMKNMLPELAMESNDQLNSFTMSTEETLKQCKNIKFFNDVILNKSVLVGNFWKTLPDLARLHGLSYDDFKEDLKQRTTESLGSLLHKLELSFNLSTMQEKPLVVCLNVSTDTPLTTIGLGDNYREALQKALDDMFTIIECLLQDLI